MGLALDFSETQLLTLLCWSQAHGTAQTLQQHWVGLPCLSRVQWSAGEPHAPSAAPTPWNVN